MSAWYDAPMQQSFEKAVDLLVARYPQYTEEAYEFMRVGLDAAADKLEAQCRDLKEKMQDHQAAALSEVETENGQTE